MSVTRVRRLPPLCGQARRPRRRPGPGSDARSRRRASAPPPPTTAPPDRPARTAAHHPDHGSPGPTHRHDPPRCHHASTHARTTRTDHTPRHATGPADSHAPTTRDRVPIDSAGSDRPCAANSDVLRTQRTSNESSQLRNSRDCRKNPATASRSAAPTSASSNTPRVSRRSSIMFTSTKEGQPVGAKPTKPTAAGTHHPREGVSQP